MKTTTLFLLITLFCSVAACKKDDNNDPDCVKEENYFTAEFGGQTLEPYWHTGFGTTGYTLNINRNSQNQNDWQIYIGIDNSRVLFFWLKGVNNVGFYPIDSGSLDDIPFPFSKTYIYIYDESYIGDPNLSNYTHFSLGNTGSIEITEYNSTSGILVGTFNCTMYSTHNEGETLPISGEFNINLQTHDTSVRPCWL